MPVSIGQRFGPYEIVSRIGAGGMGEVYRARDPRLKRDVALKVLSAAIAGDTARRQRFEQEARAVAALNHPHIVAVYDVGDGYIVSEFIDGETLRGAGFPLRKTLDIAIQISAGLAAAHDAGITHRDLKPANILLTRDGRVKILDFGLAKLRAARIGPTEETITARTEPGVVLGTVGYMAPEQVRGFEADHRADIFSFGVILHELLSGKRAFEGGTSVEIMTAILKQDPPELPESVPTPVRDIVARCLEKDPSNRFQSAKDLGFALAQCADRASFTAPMGVGAGARAGWPRPLLSFVAALVLLAFGVGTGALIFRSPVPARWSGVLLGGPEFAYGPRVSPDGHMIAFQAWVDGMTQVGVMTPETGRSAILTRERSLGSLSDIAWSPDGSTIYYERRTDTPNGIYAVPVLGGEERLVVEGAAFPNTLPDGSLLAQRIGSDRHFQVFRYWPNTGRKQDYPLETVATVSWSEGYMRPFSDGREAVVFGTRIGRSEAPRFYILDLGSGAVRQLRINDGPPRYWMGLATTRDGKSVLFARPAGNLWEVVSVPRNGGPARTCFSLTCRPHFLDAGPDGSIYIDQPERPAEIVKFSAQGGKAEILSRVNAGDMGIRVLPDGRSVVTGIVGGKKRLMAVEKDRDPIPLITTTEETRWPTAILGSHEIAFVIGPVPAQMIAIANLSDGRITRRITLGKGEPYSLASSPDGKTIYFEASDTVWAVPSEGGDPRKIRAGDSVLVDPSGGSLYVATTESSRVRLFELPIAGGQEREVVFSGDARLAKTGAIGPGKRLLAVVTQPDSWFWVPGLVDLASGAVTRIPLDYASDFQSVAWTPDGHIVAITNAMHSTIWRFQPAN